MKKKLTQKQRKFIQELPKQDFNATKAVQKAYPNIKTYDAQRTMGAKLMHNPDVLEEIDKIFEDAGVTDSWIAELIKDAGDNAPSYADRLKAARLAAEVRGRLRTAINLNTLNVNGAGSVFEALDPAKIEKARRVLRERGLGA